jgi:putative tryptophan/tyrosine transport system substrate-binding protein
MRRRDFIAGIVGLAAASPLGAHAQQPASKMRLVAVLESATTRSDDPHITVFRKQLAELGWQEGRNAQIEIRSGESNISKARSSAAELVAMRPDALLATNTQMVQLVESQTRDIPIVFVDVPDPIGSGLVSNLARPGGNVTGFTNFEPSVAGKWLEFLKEIAPGLKRVAVLLQAGNSTAFGYEKAIEAAAPTFAVEVYPASARDGPSIDSTIENLAQQPDSGLIVPPSALAVQYRERIVALAMQYRLPAMYPYDEFISSGGLIGYGIDRRALYRQAATYVDRIFKGEKAGDLPVQAPTKFELVINLKTAKSMGLTIPQSVLLLADEVIE